MRRGEAMLCRTFVTLASESDEEVRDLRSRFAARLLSDCPFSAYKFHTVGLARNVSSRLSSFSLAYIAARYTTISCPSNDITKASFQVQDWTGG
jgi:hypothetical protein